MPPVLPATIPEIVLSALLGLAVLIPVVGVTARFALKPVVDAMVKLRESRDTSDAVAMLERRMALLEQETHQISALREDIAKLTDAQDFHLRLARPGTEAPQDAVPVGGA